jgi:hypothetical protein
VEVFHLEVEVFPHVREVFHLEVELFHLEVETLPHVG